MLRGQRPVKQSLSPAASGERLEHSASILVPTFADTACFGGEGGWAMKKRQIFWAIAFGAMLAVTGCGDSSGDDNGGGGSGGTGGSGATAGSGGSSGSGGGSGSGFCGTLCEACNPDQASACSSACESQIIGSLPGGINLDSCPNELGAVGECLGANDCNSDNCDSQLSTWVSCIIGVSI